jgi:hypothetical protein
MRAIKLGRILAPDPARWWSKEYCMVPTPDSAGCAPGDALRVYYASADQDNFARVAYVDLDPENPTRIVARAEEPILDIGRVGTFDDCGVNPSCVVTHGDEVRLYYVGYQRSFRAPVLLFAGLARSIDRGRSFQRLADVPILDRSAAEPFTRTAPFVLRDAGRYRMWYVSGEGWQRTSSGKTYSRYAIRHCQSDDGVTWPGSGTVCLSPEDDSEEGFARPWVVKDGARYRMWYSIRAVLPEGGIGYDRIGYAESADGLRWTRRDDQVDLARSAAGWDAEMICYTAIASAGGNVYMFYNGNGNGKTGFGCAKLVD